VARPLRVFGVIPQRAADEEKEESKALDVLAAFRHQVLSWSESSYPLYLHIGWIGKKDSDLIGKHQKGRAFSLRQTQR